MFKVDVITYVADLRAKLASARAVLEEIGEGDDGRNHPEMARLTLYALADDGAAPTTTREPSPVAGCNLVACPSCGAKMNVLADDGKGGSGSTAGDR